MRYCRDGKLYTFEEPQRTLEERVQRLEDIRAIEECMYSYVRYADCFDAEGMASAFTQDACLFWGTGDIPNAQGRDCIYRHLLSLTGSMSTQEHFCGGFQMKFEADGTVTGDCCMHSWQLPKDENQQELFCYGHYEFSAVREDSEWRFAQLRLVLNGKMQGGKLCKGGGQMSRGWPPEFSEQIKYK